MKTFSISIPIPTTKSEVTALLSSAVTKVRVRELRRMIDRAQMNLGVRLAHIGSELATRAAARGEEA